MGEEPKAVARPPSKLSRFRRVRHALRNGVDEESGDNRSLGPHFDSMGCSAQEITCPYPEGLLPPTVQESTLENDIELISDGDGLAVVGTRSAVESFLKSVGLLALSRDLELDRLGSVLGAGAAFLQGASEIVTNSCLYLKVDKDTAQRIKEFGLMKTKTPGISYAMFGDPGAVSKWVKVENNLGSFATNPAVLSGVAGIMTQVATQQTMAEITAALANIDEKVDDILRKQDDAAVAQMVGTGHAIDRAMTIRKKSGVNATLRSTVSQSHQTIGATQTYALDQLDTIAKKLESTKVGGLAKTARQAESEVPKWLAVLARCFQLEDAIDVLELDRVLAETPEGVVAYHRGMTEARKGRRDLVSGHTKNLLDRMNAAVGTANAKMVWNRAKSMEVVESANHLAAGVHDFHGLLRIESDRRSWEERRLGTAAEVGSQVIQKTKDTAPIVAGGAALLGLIGVAGKKVPGRGVG